ncbi:hypothetical protein [Rhizomonospora bruguierae]|uniref:hypothetical protein n=1 Tax=Rhizomonospora bruguierae TaxID=1581705 RepID=UPI001BCFB402|nr:hypothetical protein [Micromonospora sp. NBRC 107566]
MPEPSAFDGLIHDLEQAMSSLTSKAEQHDPFARDGGRVYSANPVLEELPASGDLIASWTGYAAITFKQTFIDPFPALVQNQFLLVSMLRAALEAERTLWESARRDIDKIAETTLKALDAMHGSCHQTSWTLTFDIIAAVVGVALAIPTLGASEIGAAAVISLTAGAAGAGVVGDLPVESDKPDNGTKVGGHEVNEVIGSMRTAIQDYTTLVNDRESFIAQRLRGMVGTVHSRPDLFVSPRPALRDMNGGNATSGRYLGYST